MRKYTGTVILASITLIFGTISVIFGMDTVLSLGENATISYVVWENIKKHPELWDTILKGTFMVVVSSMFALGMHFKYFKPKSDKERVINNKKDI